jgi:SAM-dependent methyltransferase
MSDLAQYRASKQEKARTADLLRILPMGLHSVLDVGARDGHFSRLLTEYYEEVTSLDLQKPRFEIPRVKTVAGDVTDLQFPNESFDCVFCAEVLEHIPDLERACSEIIRVAKHHVVIGVPFKQDIRVGRTTCHSCRKIVPPWGHVNSFNETSLSQLFAGLDVTAKSFVGSSNAATNPISTFLMDLAGNPWGTYDQDEPCIHCGSRLIPPGRRPLWAKGCSFIAIRINRLQSRWTLPHGNWIHLVLSKPESASRKPGGAETGPPQRDQ